MPIEVYENEIRADHHDDHDMFGFNPDCLGIHDNPHAEYLSFATLPMPVSIG